ncbi:hypothetical protein EVAR_103617_1 [Eumeta japonica]|uniref:Uncharacterized protein n=1 Tax=Eumeta variegata TaxID=151549 RepID=A0A4C1T6S6_EUMVA|nr:hypothetical protein EVAR_103617_1 [Eumeta japonica]
MNNDGTSLQCLLGLASEEPDIQALRFEIKIFWETIFQQRHRASADCSDGTKAAVSWMHVPSPGLIKASTSAGTGPRRRRGEKIR